MSSQFPNFMIRRYSEILDFHNIDQGLDAGLVDEDAAELQPAAI